MARHFTKEQSALARNADLSAFLLRTDPGHYVKEGKTLRLIDPTRPKRHQGTSICIKMGTNWWHDFATGETGNSVSYLTEKMGYGLVDAILALSGDNTAYQRANYDPPPVKTDSPSVPVLFPAPTDKQAKQMYAYLCSRGIPADMVTTLHKAGLLYQSMEHNNLVFINKEKDFAEIRGTFTYGKPFHGVVKKQPDRFWYFGLGDNPKTKVYVCESAIDAVSLYLLLQKEGKEKEKEAYFVSLAGVANQKTIDRIKRNPYEVILAVDNDRAGQECRDRNPDCKAIIPIHKDWNEDLLKDAGNHILDSMIQAAEKTAADRDEYFTSVAKPAPER